MSRDRRNFNHPGSGHLELVQVPYVDPATSTWEAMVAGWHAQMSSRNLSRDYMTTQLKLIRRFHRATGGAYPWDWTPADLENWSFELRSQEAPITGSTLRFYQGRIGAFMDYLTDPRNIWLETCPRLFGRTPMQICTEFNTVQHISDYEGDPRRRPFTRDELDTFLAYADDRVAAAKRLGRKGWLAAFRDATVFKTLYGWGLRRNELRMLDMHDLHPNPEQPRFGDLGIIHVRYGKAVSGGAPRRRSVLSIMPEAVDALEQYVTEIRPLYEGNPVPLFPNERGGRISDNAIGKRMREYIRECGLDPKLTPHCFRHSYVTHLLEKRVDNMFLTAQLGHSWSSSTATYAAMSSDFKNQTLSDALAKAFERDE